MTIIDWIGIIFTFILVFVLAIMLLREKGSCFIAGYNMLPAEKKEKINTPKLCKFMGKVYIAVLAVMALMVISEISSISWLGIFARNSLLIIVAFTLIWGNIRYSAK